jgi:uncharacterized protein (DUF1778 family)
MSTKKNIKMTEEQFERLLETLDNIDTRLSYIGNMLEDHTRFSSENLGNLINEINKGK